MDLGTGLAILGPSISLGGIVIAVIGKVFPLATGSGQNHQASNGYISRPEFEQYCQHTNSAFGDIKRMLGGIENKLDKQVADIQRRTEDHEKRLGIIEARHRDFTGDDQVGSETMGFKSERRHGKSQDTGQRRRKTDQDGIGGNGTTIGFS